MMPPTTRDHSGNEANGVGPLGSPACHPSGDQRADGRQKQRTVLSDPAEQILALEIALVLVLCGEEKRDPAHAALEVFPEREARVGRDGILGLVGQDQIGLGTRWSRGCAREESAK